MKRRWQHRVLSKNKSLRDYLVEQVAKRDGWNCGLCMKPLHIGKSTPTRRAATLDHVIAVCVGGSNDPENLRILGGPCNSSRPDQTRFHSDNPNSA